MTNIKDLIENPHQIFKQYFNYFNFLLDAYEGGVDYCKAMIPGSSSSLKDWAFKLYAGSTQINQTVTGNLFMHPKERMQDYSERLRMSYYYNFCAPIIDIYTDHLFKQPITADFGSIEDDVAERSENIDNKGGSIGEFRKSMSEMAQIYGHIFVITDSPQYDGMVRTKADVLDNNLLPYFTLHHPQCIVNWALDMFGSPWWVIVRESADSNIDPFNYNKDRSENVQYRLWTRQEWILFDEGYDEIGRGAHGLGVVPITCVFDKQSKKVRNFLGISAIADIAFIARDVYNSCSELKQILRDQTFAFLTIQGNAGEYDELSVGTSKALLYPVDRQAPAYVSPPSANAEVYFSHIDRQVSKMFQLAKLEGGSVQAPDQSAVQQSGVSKAWDFNQTNSSLSKKAGNLEDGETKLWQNFARWLDKEFDGSIEYPHDFDINSLNSDLDEAEKMFRISLGTEFNKEVKKSLMKKKFPRMNDDDMNKMVDAMESKEYQADRGVSGSLLNRIPSLMKMTAQTTPNSGGKSGGFNAGRERDNGKQ
jgi:hypothetical protein